MKKISIHELTDDPNEMCEECHDTGYGGDFGPGGSRYNTEFEQCVCDEKLRSIRKASRIKNENLRTDKTS